jgi:transcriptional regulator with XRE-family HTH domain
MTQDQDTGSSKRQPVSSGAQHSRHALTRAKSPDTEPEGKTGQPRGSASEPASRVMRCAPAGGNVRTLQTVDPEALVRLGALVRLLRLERSMTVTELARRSLCARSTVQRLERGQLRPRRSLLAYVAYGLDSDNDKLIREALITMAGGVDALAEDGRWGRVRARRANKALIAGKMPLPSDLLRRISLHRQASACWRQATAILARPGALDDTASLDVALALMDRSKELRALAGGSIGIGWGSRRVVYGVDV